jgi:hypothetical protein
MMHPELHEAAAQLNHERWLRLREKQRMLEKTTQVGVPAGRHVTP